MRSLLPATLAALVSAAGLALAGMVLAVSWRDRVELWERFGLGFAGIVVGCLAAAAAQVFLLLRLCARPRRIATPALARGAFVSLVATWWLYLALGQPYFNYGLAVWFALGLGLWAGGALVLTRIRATGGRALRVADFALFQLALLAVLVELGASAVGALGISPLLDGGRLGARALLERQREKPGLVRMGFPCNSRGHYDHEPSRPPRERRLVASIGDSFSTGVVPHGLHYTTVAEQLTGYEVHNLGAPAIGPPEYALLLEEEALPLAPDLVVIALFVGNDLVEGSTQHGLAGFLRRIFSRERLQTTRLWQRARALQREREARDRPGGVGQAPGYAALWGKGELGLEEIRALLPWIDDPLQEPPSFSVEGFERIELPRAQAVCAPSASYRWAERELERMQALARDRGVRFALMLIPDEFQVEDALWARLVALAPGKEWSRHRPQAELARWCAERDIPCLDLLPALLAVEPLADGARHLYHLRDTHFNARGNRVAGEELARFARELLSR